MMRRRSMLLKLATTFLLAFALTSHSTSNGAVDAYKLGQFRLRYPTTVNDEEPILNSGETAARAYYYPQQQKPQQRQPQRQPIRDYDYEVLGNVGQQEKPRWAESISLSGPDRLTKYKNPPQVERMGENNEREVQNQIESILRSLYTLERQQKLGEKQQLERQQAQAQPQPQAQAQAQQQQQHPQKKQQPHSEQQQQQQQPARNLPQPMKKETSQIDPLEDELFRMQRKPLEDAETMNKDTNDNSEINQESIIKQNYDQQSDILKRKLSDDNGSALVKNEPQEATYQHYRQVPNSFQSADTNSNERESFLASISDLYFVAMVVCVSSVAICSVIGAGYCFYKVQQKNRQAADVEFPAYGVIGPNTNGDCGINSPNGSAATSKCASPPADRKLTQAAQMYHYQHQKQQMISNERNVVRISNHGTANSDLDSDEENEDGEYTVYECPGLAPTGEMEVKNPLFQDDLTPMSSPQVMNGKPLNK